MPGREAVDAEGSDDIAALSSAEDSKAHGYIRALGGSDNLNSVSACTTRLRLEVKDNKAIDETALKRLGARGVIRPSEGALQVVLGPTAELTADEIKAVLASSGPIDALSAKPENASKLAAAAPAASLGSGLDSGLDAKAILAALGGAGNISALKSASTRLVLTLNDAEALDESALTKAGVRAVARLRGGLTHLVSTLGKIAFNAFTPLSGSCWRQRLTRHGRKISLNIPLQFFKLHLHKVHLAL